MPDIYMANQTQQYLLTKLLLFAFIVLSHRRFKAVSFSKLNHRILFLWTKYFILFGIIFLFRSSEQDPVWAQRLCQGRVCSQSHVYILWTRGACSTRDVVQGRHVPQYWWTCQRRHQHNERQGRSSNQLGWGKNYDLFLSLLKRRRLGV